MVYTERTHWTAADLAALPDDGYHYELVKGRLIQMPPTTAEIELIITNTVKNAVPKLLICEATR